MKTLRLYTICVAALLLSCSGCGANPGTTGASPDAGISITQEEHDTQTEQTEAPPKALPVQLTMQDMVDNGTEKDPVCFEYNEEGYLTSVTGRFCKEQVTNSEEAFTLLASLSEVLRIGNVYDEIRLESEDSGMLDVYVFRQYYQGIPVTDRALKITVRDESKEAVGLINGYVPELSIPLEFHRTAEDIQKQASEIFSDNCTFFELYPAINCDSDGMPSLVWEIVQDREPTLLLLRIDDASGEILYQVTENE